jgi:hypothetical protein
MILYFNNTTFVSFEIVEKGILKASEHDKYKTLADSV